MTIASATSKVTYNGDDSTTSFPTVFKFYQDTHVRVIHRDSSGTETVWVDGTQYTLTGGDGSIGTVVVSTSPTDYTPATGEQLVIKLSLPETQPDALPLGGDFPSTTVEKRFDQTVQMIQAHSEQIARSLTAPETDTASSLVIPNETDRASKYLVFDANGVPTVGALPSTLSGTDSSYVIANIAALRNVTGGTGQGAFVLQYDSNDTDGAGGGPFRWVGGAGAGTYTDNGGTIIVPTGGDGSEAWLREYQTISPEMFGVIDSGATDSREKLQDAMNFITGVGGGTLRCPPGRTYRVTLTESVTDKGLIIPDNVTLDLNGSTLLLDCTGDVYGVRLKNYSWITNGTVSVDTSASPGSAGIWHSPVSIGPAYGEGGTAASPSSFEGVKGWGIYNIKVASVRAGSVGVQGYGACHHGYVGHVRADDSSTLAGVVGFDWGTIGGIDSNDVAGSRTAFDAGTAYTTHPHDIKIERISAGALSRDSGEGSRCVRLSAVHNITVDGVEVTETNYSGVYHTAGDLGYEFAQVAIKPFRHKGIVVRNVSINDANDGWGVFCDCYADNIDAAGGYSPLLDVIQTTDIVFENVRTRSDGGASVIPGFRFQKMIGGTVRNCGARGHEQGFLVEEGCDSLKIIGGDWDDNREDGIYAGHGSDLPEDLTIVRAHCGGNGTDSGHSNPAGINLQGVTRAKIIGNLLSHATETTQYRGVTVSTTCTGITIKDNHCEDLDTGGQAYVLASSTTYSAVDEFSNNTVGAGVPNYVAGVNIIPWRSVVTPAGAKVRYCVAAKAALTANTTPTAGTWVAGDVIEYSDPSASDYKGTVCVTGGAPGTWKRYGATTA